jgi:hypothetical protein
MTMEGWRRLAIIAASCRRVEQRSRQACGAKEQSREAMGRAARVVRTAAM